MSLENSYSKKEYLKEFHLIFDNTEFKAELFFWESAWMLGKPTPKKLSDVRMRRIHCFSKRITLNSWLLKVSRVSMPSVKKGN